MALAEKQYEEAVKIAKRDAVLAVLNQRGKYASRGKAFERIVISTLEDIAEGINSTEYQLQVAREEAQDLQAAQTIKSYEPSLLVVAALGGTLLGFLGLIARFLL